MTSLEQNQFLHFTLERPQRGGAEKMRFEQKQRCLSMKRAKTNNNNNNNNNKIESILLSKNAFL